MRAKITKNLVDALTPGQAVTDTHLEGFRVRCGRTGKFYSVQKRIGKRVKTRTIGRHGIFTADEARKAAKSILLHLSQGIDPLDAKRKLVEQQAITFGRLVDLYLEKRHLAESTKKDIRTKVKTNFADWLSLSAADITRQMVIAKHETLMKAGATQAALLARYTRAIFNFGIAYFTDGRTGESLIPQNPIHILTTMKLLRRPRRRNTFIKEQALRAWFAAWSNVRAEHATACDYILTTLLLGCRRSEAARLPWVDVDLEDRTVCFPDTKNKTDHLMPMGDYLTELLARRHQERADDCEYVFPARNGGGHLVDPRDAMEKISKLAGVRFIMSDLRRTFATHSAAIGIHYFDIRRLLNHKVDNREATPGYIVAELQRKRVFVRQLEDFLSKGCRFEGDRRATISRFFWLGEWNSTCFRRTSSSISTNCLTRSGFPKSTRR